ncbi:MAG: hypothetical protein IJQ39_06825 [Thermoguttaceae bacterium]|nr:hypothetical protein [Thermoguttaceae bacterium]
MSNNSCKKRIVGILFALIMLSFAVVFLTFAIRNIKTLISDSKTVYYCLDYNVLNRQTDEDIAIREERLRICYNHYVNKLLSEYTLFNSCKSYMLDIYGLCAKFQGLYRLHNSNYLCVRLSNDSLSICADYDDMVTTSEYLISFKKYLDERNIPALYVIAPHKHYKYYHSLLPRGVSDFETENSNRLVSRIEGCFPVIDNREIFKNDPEKHYRLFYRGDSHWKVQYAFLSYCQIMQYLEKRYSITFEEKLRSIENYSTYSIERYGDLSKQFGRFYLPPDKMEYLNPLFKTHVRLYSNNNRANIYDIDYSGDFNMKLFHKDYPHLNVYNPDAANKKKLMVIGDSFSPFVMSLLSLSFEQVEYHSMNSYRDNLKKEVEAFQPDYVICMFTSRQTLIPIFKVFSE